MVKDWANPLVAKHIHRYPVMVQDGVISEVWNGRQWRHDLDRHLMSPMYDAGNGKPYSTDEPAHLTNGRNGWKMRVAQSIAMRGRSSSTNNQCVLYLLGESQTHEKTSC